MPQVSVDGELYAESSESVFFFEGNYGIFEKNELPALKGLVI